MLNLIQNNRGSALVVALLMLIMLSFIGIASITTSVRDMDIAKNTTDRTHAFYVAEAGLDAAQAIMGKNGSVVGNDTLLQFISPYTTMPYGTFSITLSGAIPFKTVTSVGNTPDGQAAVQVTMRRRRAPSVWNNILFAGTGQQGKAVLGNISYHGPVTILGDGEDFTDANGNGNWDPADTYTDSNGNGVWNPGEPLTKDTNGNGIWDPAEPYLDDNGNGLYDNTLTATDLAAAFSGSAGLYNNYTNIPANIFSRIPALTPTLFNGEMVYSLDAELRVKHGVVNLSGSAQVGESNLSGGSPAVKETFDGTYVTDGWGGSGGASSVYSDNGTSNPYDYGDELSFPSLLKSYTDPITGTTYPTYASWLQSNALVIPGNVTLKPGVTYAGGSNGYGSISMDVNGKITISGIVYISGNIIFEQGSGSYKNSPILYQGKGTIVSGGDITLNSPLLSNSTYPTTDILGLLSTNNINMATGNGSLKVDIMAALFAQKTILTEKHVNIAGAMVSNYFSTKNVPDFWFVPTLQDNLPPGMPGRGTGGWVYKKVPGTWREL